MQERFRARAGIGADQYLSLLVVGELGQRVIQRSEVVGAVPRRGLPRSQVDRESLTSAVLAVVDE